MPKKITEDENALRRPNIHYTGQRSYDEPARLPEGCDVALIPFALSDATRYLSPTKTLEYFAARRPVVSTPIQDIVEHYADAARIAHTPEEFVRACEAALGEDNAARLERGEGHAQGQHLGQHLRAHGRSADQAVARNLGRPIPPPAAGAWEGRRGARTGGRHGAGQVLWYSGSRGAGVVDTGGGDEVMAFLPGSVQEDLGGEGGRHRGRVHAGPAHLAAENERGTDMFPLGLDKILNREKS